MGEGDLRELEEREGALERGLVLAGEANDHVGPQPDPGGGCAQARDQLFEIRDTMGPPHGPEDPVVAALHRQVDVLTQARARRVNTTPEQLHERRVDFVWIDRAKPQARARVVAQQRGDEPGETPLPYAICPTP